MQRKSCKLVQSLANTCVEVGSVVTGVLSFTSTDDAVWSTVVMMEIVTWTCGDASWKNLRLATPKMTKLSRDLCETVFIAMAGETFNKNVKINHQKKKIFENSHFYCFDSVWKVLNTGRD
jgi:hypothetical protein